MEQVALMQAGRPANIGPFPMVRTYLNEMAFAGVVLIVSIRKGEVCASRRGDALRAPWGTASWLVRVCAVAALGAGLCGAALGQSAPSLDKVLSEIELRYNRLATLQVDFEHTMKYLNRQPLVERGTLYLRRPGKMRWEYSKPAGKLLVGDGDLLHYYNPKTNQVRLLRPSQTGDLRVPLSFLLGRLHFKRQFRNLRLEERDGMPAVIAEGRTGKEAYSRVEFLYDPADYELVHLKVYGQDESMTTFAFSDETLNPLLENPLFEFRAPAGAEIVNDARLEESN